MKNIFKWIEGSPLFTCHFESNEYNDFDLVKELMKKFNKTKAETLAIIREWKKTKGY
jgi:hypothetical protein